MKGNISGNCELVKNLKNICLRLFRKLRGHRARHVLTHKIS